MTMVTPSIIEVNRSPIATKAANCIKALTCFFPRGEMVDVMGIADARNCTQFKTSIMAKQAGFTLIELAIVIIIIGLLLGGVLKGQVVINSAKVKKMAADFRNIQVYVYGYQDKYRTLPGDDPNAQGHVGATATNGNGDRNIDGAWNSVNPADESLIFWQHVRMAGFVQGDITVAATGPYIPVNAENGRIGIQSGQTPSITGLRGDNVMCSGSVPGKYSKQLDVNMDDGNPETGSIMIVKDATPGTSNVTGASTVAPTILTAIGDNDFTTICMAF